MASSNVWQDSVGKGPMLLILVKIYLKHCYSFGKGEKQQLHKDE